MPTIAIAIAAHVRGGIGAFSTARASRAVVNGPTASTINVLAVDVSVSASMKQVNITAHMAPDINPAIPVRRSEATKSRRTSRNPPTKIAANTLRQNVISNRPCACSSGDK